MSVSRMEAHASARRFLGQTFSGGSGWTVVMQPELSFEHDFAWCVRFDSQEHLNTGNRALAPFTRVVVVPKNGEAPHFPPTHLPVAAYLDQLAAGDWTPTKD